MLSGGTVSRFREPRVGERIKGKTLGWRLLDSTPCLLLSPYLWFPEFPSSGFRKAEHFPSEGNQKYRLCLAQPLLRLSYTTSWLPIELMLGWLQ